MSARLPAVFLLFIAAALTFFIDSRLAASGDMQPADPLSRLIGSAKEAVGDTLFLKADTYFHGGVTEAHPGESAESLRQEGMIGREGTEAPESAPKDWIARINTAVHTSEHRHLTHGERKEMLPFFALSTALDPHNVEALLTTAYWLENEFDKVPQALDILRKGARDNPQSWEIERELGGFYLKRKDDAGAEKHFEAALRMAGNSAEGFERVEMLYHLGETRLAQGKKTEALEAYRRALALNDRRTAPAFRAAIAAKVEELSK